MMTINWVFIEETKNHAIYQEMGTANGKFQNKIYLPKGLPHKLTSEWDDGK